MRRAVLSLVLIGLTALPATAMVPVGAPNGLYLVGEVVPRVRLCAYRFDTDKVRVIASTPGGLLIDDVVTTVAEAQFETFVNAYGRQEMRLEVDLPNTLGQELDMQLYAGGGAPLTTLGPGYGYHVRSTGPTYRAGQDSTAWIGANAYRNLAFEWGYGTGACYVSPR